MERTEKGSDMQTSIKSTGPNETFGSTNTPPVKLLWTLQRLNRTWFLFEGQALRIEKLAEDGATDEQWRGYLLSNGVRIKNTGSKPLGPMARRDLLNWLENEHPDRMPLFFDSKEFALSALTESKTPVSRIEEESNKTSSMEGK